MTGVSSSLALGLGTSVLTGLTVTAWLAVNVPNGPSVVLAVT